MQYWNDLSIDFMSEESDDPDDSNSLIIHKLPWVSESEFKVKPTCTPPPPITVFARSDAALN